jgi:hypothetical protein
MNNTYIVAVVLIVVIMGAIMGPIFAHRRRTERQQKQFDTKHDHAVEAKETEKKAHVELKERQKHVDALDIRPLSTNQREHFLMDWMEIQANFVDEPGQALIDADRLITEVMKFRSYPVSDFEQRASDLSVNYPELVSRYRAARAVSLKNDQKQADTEELRIAMLDYRSLFEELLGREPSAAKQKAAA